MCRLNALQAALNGSVCQMCQCKNWVSFNSRSQPNPNLQSLQQQVHAWINCEGWCADVACNRCTANVLSGLFIQLIFMSLTHFTGEKVQSMKKLHPVAKQPSRPTQWMMLMARLENRFQPGLSQRHNIKPIITCTSILYICIWACLSGEQRCRDRYKELLPSLDVTL